MRVVEKLENIMKGLYCCTRSGQNVKRMLCDECPYKDKVIMDNRTVWKTCRNYLCEDALYMLQMHYPRVKVVG